MVFPLFVSLFPFPYPTRSRRYRNDALARLELTKQMLNAETHTNLAALGRVEVRVPGRENQVSKRMEEKRKLICSGI